MQQLLQYLAYFLVGGIGTVIVAYLNTTGKSGLGALVSTLPIHFLTNVLIAGLVAGSVTALGFSRMSVVTNIAWVVSVIVFAVALQHTHSLLIAALLCAAASVVATLAINYTFNFA